MGKIVRALIRNNVDAHTTRHFTSKKAMREWCKENDYEILRHRELEENEGFKGEVER